MASGDRRAYQTLEAMRGVGAALILVRHAGFLFPTFQAPESYLAVDLFYLVSGFVISHAYQERLLKGETLFNFMRTRVIRLYPLYIVGLTLGFAAAAYAAVTDPKGWWTWPRIAEAALTGLIMIPKFPGMEFNGSTLDGPTWTLWPELVANALYAALIRWMRLPLILAIALVGALGVVAAELKFDGLDVGYSSTDQWAALARVTWSFFAGVAVERLFGGRRIQSDLGAVACAAVTGLILAFRPSDDISTWFELGAVLVGFPAIVAIACQIEPSAAPGKFYARAGLLSYGVYIIHQPTATLIHDALGGRGPRPGDPKGLVFGLAFMVAMFWLAGFLDRRWDAPLRARIRAWLERKPA